jgi:hypothetical protein
MDESTVSELLGTEREATLARIQEMPGIQLADLSE